MFSEEKKGSSSRKSCQQCETKNLKEISSETFLVSNFFKTDSKTFSVLNFSETVSKTFYGTNFVWDRYYRTRQKYKRPGNGIPRRDPNRRQDQFQDFFTLFCFGSSHPPPPPPPAPPAPPSPPPMPLTTFHSLTQIFQLAVQHVSWDNRLFGLSFWNYQ